MREQTSDEAHNTGNYAIGKILGDKYEVTALAGVGGAGKVYKVRQIFLNKILALKVLDSRQGLSSQQIRRFQIEAKAAFTLNHPNLVRVYDFGLLENDTPYLVMDFVDGITLQEWIKKNGLLTPQQVVKVFTQACAGLEYAHQRQVVHRDIKPSNIMLDRQSNIGATNSVKIVDFGIAKFADDGEIQGLTKTGEIFGSPFYMSPEQGSGDEVDYRSDIYSLGCTLFECLTGTPPHVGNTVLRTLMLHQSAKAPLLREASLGKHYPDELEQIVEKMLQKNPDERYQIIDEVSVDLKNLLTDKKEKSAPAETAELELKTRRKEDRAKSNGLNRILILFAIAATAATLIVLDRLYVQQTRQNQNVKVGTQKLIDDVAPIKKSFYKKNGVTIEQINFPAFSIGSFSSNRLAITRPPSLSNFSKNAIGVVDFAPSDFLRLNLENVASESLPQPSPVFENPSILKMIEPDLFDELVVDGKNIKLSGIGDDALQSNTLEQVLENASAWTRLSGLYLNDAHLTKRVWLTIEKIEKLRYLKLSECDIDPSLPEGETFLKGLKFLSLTELPHEKFVQALSGSTNLEYICLKGEPISPATIKVLQKCPNLKNIELKPPSVDMNLIEALANWRGLNSIVIGDTALSEQQVRYLMKNNRSLKTLILNAKSGREVAQLAREDSRIHINNLSR